MPSVVPSSSDIFQRQMTETLRAKGVKKLSDLVHHYKNIEDAIDEDQSDPQSYERAKYITLRFKKRDGDFTDLKKMWSDYEQQSAEDVIEKGKNEAQTTTAAAARKTQDQGELTDITSDKDLATVIKAMVQEPFLNPESGYWLKYDAQFDRQFYLKLGRPGWEKPENEAARQDINRAKNEEVTRILQSEFCKSLATTIHESIMTRVFGVHKRYIQTAMKKHVRQHISQLIYSK
ncbi:hypothetical protein MIR68_009947 [Amoeboaphelidium protococcarum]|nr:hypothetical protein MIR68_009947 [Amoeboaphelidium protococcarum]